MTERSREAVALITTIDQAPPRAVSAGHRNRLRSQLSQPQLGRLQALLSGY